MIYTSRSYTDLTKTSRNTTLLQHPTNTKVTAKTVFIFTHVKDYSKTRKKMTIQKLY